MRGSGEEELNRWSWVEEGHCDGYFALLSDHPFYAMEVYPYVLRLTQH